MPVSLPYMNTLHMSPHGKSIPYPKKGQANHGFRNLKRSPDLIDSIPELLVDEELKSLVKSLNAQDSSFFSIGCFQISPGANNSFLGLRLNETTNMCSALISQ